MNRINQLFQDKQRNILSIYYPAGYPALEDTLLILSELERQGADLVELGIPFSDPMADGPVIQEASTQALRNGISLSKIFEQLEGFREKISIPVILMGYLNPIMQYGFERFCEACNRTGIDGVIIPDLPFAVYMSEYKEIARRHGVHIVMLISPETSDDRIRRIDEHTEGFIYMVSSASTTGAQSSFDEAKQDYFRRVESLSLRNPRLIGFGVSNGETYRAACAHSSGVIVGSKFVQLLGSESSPAEAVKRLLEVIRE